MPTTGAGNALPQDPAMLLSFINTQLRDQYPSLRELCAALGASEQEIREKLSGIDHVYDAELNRFV